MYLIFNIHTSIINGCKMSLALSELSKGIFIRHEIKNWPSIGQKNCVGGNQLIVLEWRNCKEQRVISTWKISRCNCIKLVIIKHRRRLCDYAIAKRPRACVPLC